MPCRDYSIQEEYHHNSVARKHEAHMRMLYKELYDVSPNSSRDTHWMAARMCKTLSDWGTVAVGSLSLELQIWWRDHQIADAEEAKLLKALRAGRLTKVNEQIKLLEQERSQLEKQGE